MYNSTSRVKKQWKLISKILRDKDDIVPFKYGKNIRLYVEEEDEEFKVYSKRDFAKKQKLIFEKYGPETPSQLLFNLNVDLIYADVERKAAKLLGTKVEKKDGKDSRK